MLACLADVAAVIIAVWESAVERLLTVSLDAAESS